MLNITLKQMVYIEAAGRLGSIANAATELNISQSSISAAINALEDDLQYDIFVRVPAKGIQPTPAGRNALQTMREFLDQLRHFETEIRSIGGEASGVIRIACFVTAVGSFLPPILRKFSLAYPKFTIELIEENMEGVVTLLNDGKADMVFTYKEMAEATHIFEPLIDVPPYALVSRNDELARQEDVSLAELATRPMVLFDLPRTTGYYSRFLTDAGFDIRIAHTTESVEMVRTLVANGFGFSILNALSPEYIDGRSLYKALPIRDKLTPRVFGILRRAGVRQPAVIRAFIDLCGQLKAERMFESMIVGSSGGRGSTKNKRDKAQ